MELYHLRSFVAVAEEGHLSRAAERLHLSQPSLSAHIKTLEEELGLALFARTPKGMLLTEAGRLLKIRAEETLRSVDSLRAEAQGLRGDLSGGLRLGLHTDPGFLRAAELAAALSGKHPRLSVHMLQTTTSEASAAVRSGRLDGSFAYGESFDQGLDVLELTRVRLCVVGPTAWRERMASASWSELADMPWVWVPGDCPFLCAAQAVFSRLGKAPRTALVADREEAIRAFIAAGSGLGFMREDEALEAELSGKVCVWQGDGLPLALSFLTASSRREDPLVRAVLSAVAGMWSAGARDG